MSWLQENGLLATGLVLMAVGLWWLLPRPRLRSRVFGLALAIAGVGITFSTLPLPAGPVTRAVLTWVFAGLGLISAVLMVTSFRPFYAALWFALVTLATSGLFLLQSAPFLAAATVIVYAGAIIVTFLFVIMLAQQSGARGYDRRALQPLAATIGALILLGALLTVIRISEPGVAGAAELPPSMHAFSRSSAEGSLHGIGQALFGDYLYAVELAGTVLLVAAIGAIAIAPRRSRGTL